MCSDHVYGMLGMSSGHQEAYFRASTKDPFILQLARLRDRLSYRQFRSYRSGTFLQHSYLSNTSRQQCSWPCRSVAVLAATAAAQTAGPGDRVIVRLDPMKC